MPRTRYAHNFLEKKSATTTKVDGYCTWLTSEETQSQPPSLDYGHMEEMGNGEPEGLHLRYLYK
jgi:hypothetical protein